MIMQSSDLSEERAEEVTVVEVQDDQQSVIVEAIDQEGAEEAVTIEIQAASDLQWIEGVTKSLNECREKTRGRWPCTIFKVPEDFRKGDEKAFDPFIVTIGPYHYLKPINRTVMAMQEHKWHCVRRLLSRHTKSSRKATDLLAKCLMAMQEMDADVRGSYVEHLHHLTARDLALIMFLDGCFIIHVLLNKKKLGNFVVDTVTLPDENNDGDNQEENNIAGGAGGGYKEMVVLDVMKKKQTDIRVVGPGRAWVMMLYDLVKVENQIPFIIIQTLFNELRTPEDEHINLVKIARRLLRPIHLSTHSDDLPLPKSNDVHHLLHLFHSTFVPSPDCLEINSTEQEMDSDWIPTATELQLAGVEFVRKEERTKESVCCFLDISFKNGIIEVPQLTLYHATITLLRNLIAYEQCYRPLTNEYVTAYVCFMDYMINTPKDVQLFELKGIFVNELGTPENAATLFNQLCQQVQQPTSYLQGSIQGMKIYYESKWHKWRARLMRDYFDNPWAILSLAAALILLVLTVEQSFFSAYSYFCPPKN